MHNVAPGPATTPENLPHDLLHPAIDIRGLHPRAVGERECAEGRRCVAHHSAPLKKRANGTAVGRSCGGAAQAEGEGGRGWRNTQCAIAAAVESVYGVDLKRAGSDPGLLDGDDSGGGAVERLRRALIDHGTGYHTAIEYGLNVRTTSTLGRTTASRVNTRIDSAWVSQRVRRYASG